MLTNIGNAYDKWSGHFTAHVNGLYMFSCTIMAVNKVSSGVLMVKDGQVMAYAYSNSSPWETGSISLVLVLKRGDRVWIRRHYGGRLIRGNYTLFSGYLISRNI